MSHKLFYVPPAIKNIIDNDTNSLYKKIDNRSSIDVISSLYRCVETIDKYSDSKEIKDAVNDVILTYETERALLAPRLFDESGVEFDPDKNCLVIDGYGRLHDDVRFRMDEHDVWVAESRRDNWRSAMRDCIITSSDEYWRIIRDAANMDRTHEFYMSKAQKENRRYTIVKLVNDIENADAHDIMMVIDRSREIANKIDYKFTRDTRQAMYSRKHPCRDAWSIVTRMYLLYIREKC